MKYFDKIGLELTKSDAHWFYIMVVSHYDNGNVDNR